MARLLLVILALLFASPALADGVVDATCRDFGEEKINSRINGNNEVLGGQAAPTKKAPAQPLANDDLSNCAGKNPVLIIKGCTNIIVKGADTAANMALAYNNRGKAYYCRVEYDRAIADYDQAISRFPKFGPSFLNRAEALEKKGEWERAVDDWQAGIIFSYGALLAEAKTRLATAKEIAKEMLTKNCEGGNFDLSIKSCTAIIKKGLEKSENVAKAYFNRGLAYAKNDELEKALEDFRQVIMSPNNDLSESASCLTKQIRRKIEYSHPFFDPSEDLVSRVECLAPTSP